MVTINNNTGATITGSNGLMLTGDNHVVNNSGRIEGTGGSAIQLNNANNILNLNGGSLIMGNILSNGSGNRITLAGNGTLNGDIAGSTGISTLSAASGKWLLEGNVLLANSSGAGMSISSGATVTLTGDMSRLGNTATLSVSPLGTLNIGNGGTMGAVLIPFINNGVITIYRSDDDVDINSSLTGNGVLNFRGTGVEGQSFYSIGSDNNSFSGNLVVMNGARVRLTTRDPTPDAHFIIDNGGTLWLGGTANFLTPIVVSGNGWKESMGQLGALRLDSGAIAGGPVTLAGDTRITAVFSDYTGTIAGPVSDKNSGYVLEKSGDGQINLLGNNTWTGGLLLSAGTLGVVRDNNLGAASAPLRFNGGALKIGGSFTSSRPVVVNAPGGHITTTGTNILTGALSGNGPLTLDSGTLALAGSDTRTGSTTIASGATLQVGHSSINGGAQGSLSGNVVNNGSLNFARTGSLTYGGTLSGSGALTKQQSGAVTLTGGGSLRNAGQIIMASPIPASTLTVNGNYQGDNGTLILSTVLGGDDSATDRLVVHGDTLGTTQVVVNNAGGTGAKTNNGINLIQVDGNSAGQFTLANRLVAGSYEYFLRRGAQGQSDANWYLSNNLPTPPNPPVPPVPPTPPEPVLRPEAGSYMANQSVAQTIFNQRLEDRSSRAEGSTLWLRQIGSRSTWHDNSSQLKSTADSYMVQGGGDLAQWQTAGNGRLDLGVMFGYATSRNKTVSDPTGYRSDGNTDGYSGGLYATWYQNGQTQTGLYVDSWLQNNGFDARVSGQDLPEEKYGIHGWNASLESGYKARLTQTLWLTPQAQLIWNNVQAGDHTEANGTRVRSDDGAGVQSRVGVKLSHEMALSSAAPEARKLIAYLETNWLHNSDESAVVLDNERVSWGGMRNAGEVRLGLSGEVARHVTVWGNLSQTVGTQNDHSTAGLLGVSYTF